MVVTETGSTYRFQGIGAHPTGMVSCMMLFTHGVGKIKSGADKKKGDFDKKCDVDRASSVLLFPTFWCLSYFFLLLGKIPTFSSFHLN